ncbi:hypothetical protein BDW22DRAFT_1341302 [Trametopsis cervina]|nr:hypothetical protein BDW22DRAFT_1341302 [Trametopsis cervina]
MWIAHFAQGLVAKPFAPRVPLALLTFAGALPDALFFLLQFLGIETFNFDQGIANHAGCFPYTNDYPFSHSLAGMVVSGAVLAVLYKAFARVPATPKDLAIIVATSASHFLLEWPSHREDIKLTPNDAVQLGGSLFDHPVATFLTEVALFFFGLWVYSTFTPAGSKAGINANPNLLTMLSVFMVAQQAHFCFGAAPTSETRWVHAPLFLFEIVASCWMLGWMDGQTNTLGINGVNGNAPEVLKKLN